MQVLPFMLAAALIEAPLPIYYTSDAQKGIEDNWPHISHRRDGPCAIDVTGNGLFFRISMSGFAPGEIGEFHLANGDMKPVRYRFKSDGEGEFSKIYIPFRQHRFHGVVSVNARSSYCSVSASFPWEAATVRVH